MVKITAQTELEIEKWFIVSVTLERGDSQILTEWPNTMMEEKRIKKLNRKGWRFIAALIVKSISALHPYIELFFY